jgi:arsenate reductase
MAAAFLRHHAGDRIAVRSAGTSPADHINPVVIEAMAEVGIDILATGAHPKMLSDAMVHASDVVITMGCGDQCPIFPGVEYLDWSLSDPAGQSIEAIRPIRDAIEHRVRGLVDRLLLEPQGSPP